MRIERHIFGSKDGYQTLAASPGLSADACKALNGFAFGTIYDSSVRDSFKKSAGYWSRPVGQRYRAITRILPGEPDDAGRQTLLFISAIVPTEYWDQVLTGDARPLLNRSEFWKWDRSARIPAYDAEGLRPTAWTVTGRDLQRVLGMLSLLEQSWSFRRPVVAREQSYTLDDILAVERLIPPAIRGAFSAVYRGVDGAMPVTLNCLAHSVQAAGANPFRELIGAVSPYAKRLVREGLQDGRFPLPFIQNYRHFAVPVVESAEDESEYVSMNTSLAAPRASSSRRRSPALLVTSTVLALVFGAAIGWFAHRPPPTPPPAPNPWPAVAAQAVALPLTPGIPLVRRLQDFGRAFQSAAAETSDPSSGEGDRIPKRAEAIEALVVCDSHIREVSRGDQDAIRNCEEEIERVKEALGDDAGLFTKWLSDSLTLRTLPPSDTLQDAAQRLHKSVQSLRDLDRDSKITKTERDDAQKLNAALVLLTSVGLDDAANEYAGDISFLNDLLERSKPPPSPKAKNLARDSEGAKTDPLSLSQEFWNHINIASSALPLTGASPDRKLLSGELHQILEFCDKHAELGSLASVLRDYRMLNDDCAPRMNASSVAHTIEIEDETLRARIEECLGIIAEFQKLVVTQGINKERTRLRRELRDRSKEVVDRLMKLIEH